MTLEKGVIGLKPMPRSLVLMLCLLAGGCAAAPARSDTPPAQEVQPTAGADDPLLLSPAGLGITTSLRVPDRLHFAFASAQLDPNAWIIAVLQAQVLRNRAGDTTTLTCRAAAGEVARLGADLARDLAMGRCQAVAAVYRDLGVPAETFEQSVAPMESGADGSEARNATLIVQPGPESRQREPAIPFIFDDPPWSQGHRDLSGLFLPDEVFFAWDSKELSLDAKAILNVIATVTHPQVDIFLSCFQNPGEGMTGPGSNSLARARCQAARRYLVEQGHCEHRVINGPVGGAEIIVRQNPYATAIIDLDNTDWLGRHSTFPSCQ